MKRIICASWNPHRSVRISYSADRDLRHLRQLLESSTKFIWHRLLSLLIPGCPHFVGQSDACNIAIGGICSPLLLQWRIFNSVFICLPKLQAASPEEPVFHINIHEFIALIINYFFMMVSFTHLHHQCSPILTDLDRCIFLLEEDSTSALSWMSRLSNMCKSHLCNLLFHIVF